MPADAGQLLNLGEQFMLAGSRNSAPSLVPLMRYRDVTSAVEWLCEAFGFERDVVVRERDGSIFYAQLRYGSGMVMLGGVREGDLDKLMRQPDEVGGAETQCCYLVVEDADAHYAKATAHGAEIMLELKTDGLGRRGYSCRDPQGHIWNFGTYNPWKGKQTADDEPEPRAMRIPASIPTRPAAAALIVFLLLAGVSMSWFGGSAPRPATEISRSDRIDERVAEAVAIAERGFRKDLAEERSAKTTAEQALQEARDALARERTLRESAEKAAEDLKVELARVQADKATAEKAADAAREDLKRVQSSGGKAAGLSPAELERERAAKEAALHAKAEAEEALKAERDARADVEKELEEARQREAKQAAQLETSATAAAVEAALEKSATAPAASTSVVAAQPPAEAKSQPRVPRRRSVVRYPPTYVTGLSDVPWPYNVWYDK